MSSSAVSPIAPGAGTFRLLVLDGKPVRWALPTSGLPPVVTYAFLTRPTGFKGTRNCDRMLPAAAALAPSNVGEKAFRREVRAAFDIWQSAARIDFRETRDIDKAGIVIGADAGRRGRAFTNVMPHGAAGKSVSGISQSLICLSPAVRWKIGFNGNLDVYDLRYTVAHEIGHAIGLDHPSPSGQLMSFKYGEQERALRPGDRAGVVALYGARGPGAPRAAKPHELSALMQGAARSSGKREEPPFGIGRADEGRRTPR